MYNIPSVVLIDEIDKADLIFLTTSYLCSTACGSRLMRPPACAMMP